MTAHKAAYVIALVYAFYSVVLAATGEAWAALGFAYVALFLPLLVILSSRYRIVRR
jgi:hydrogenase-4 membrane subunit HyfE